jgi:hypothetical protein
VLLLLLQLLLVLVMSRIKRPEAEKVIGPEPIGP